MAQQPGHEETIYTVGNGVTEPIVVTSSTPTYTPEALAAKVHGTVTLECIVGTDGCGLDESSPATRVKVRLSLEMNFHLK